MSEPVPRLPRLEGRRPSLLRAIGIAALCAWLAACGSSGARKPAAGAGSASSAPGNSPAAHRNLPAAHHSPAALAYADNGCARSGCHLGIEPIRQPDTEMMQRIVERGRAVGDPDGCAVCHGGTPTAETARAAHAGTLPQLAEDGGPDDFFPDPASPWVNERSCGPCHRDHVRAQWTSLMMTEAGKIQGTTWGFGALEGYEHSWGNYDAQNPDPHQQLGTDAYRAYMRRRRALHPNVYPDRMETLPPAPTGGADVEARPELAAFTYIRTECQRCHLGVRGRARRGDFRGMGCGACHIPYSNEGFYEGSDRSVPDTPGHPLVHSIQATRDAVVYVHDQAYTGIPVETCTTCHNRGKRIGVSYQGLMESAWGSPYTEGGGGQRDLHSKHYIKMQEDIHHQRGMLCQDCHTSLDVHSDGLLTGSNLAAVEIECADCHGTPDAYPWELPLGFGDEGGREEVEKRRPSGPPRGTAGALPRMLRAGHPHEKEDGYLRTARGNPMPEVVRRGRQVIVHTAGGRDLTLTPLKAMQQASELSIDAEVAMVHVDQHIETMECYACHTQWAPQCYGCHIKVDYSAGKSFDWVAAGHLHQDPAHRTDGSEAGYADMAPATIAPATIAPATMVAGKITELRSFLRWEDPALGVNGEGRISPIIPGCQTTVTVIGKDGRPIVRNHIFRTPAHTEGGDEDGQLAIDMSPVHPHTVGPARSCESCHASDKALGYGIGGGGLNPPWSQASVVDLTTADGRILPRRAPAQIEAIAGLRDWTAAVDREGQQQQTVGHHFRGSGPLSAQTRANMERKGICVGCHQDIPERDPAISVLHHVATYLDALPKNAPAHNGLVHKIALTAAWTQVLLAFGLGAASLGLVFLALRRFRRRGFWGR